MSNRNAAIFLILVVVFSFILTRSTIDLLIALAAAWLFQQIFLRRNRNIILLAVSCALSFLLFEFAGSAILRGKVEQEFNTDIDHRLKFSRKRGINKDGIRSQFSSAYFREDSYNIIFLGDSFTYGARVEREVAFPGQIETIIRERALAVEVKIANFGWGSASPLLQLRQLQDIGAKYNPDLVVLTLDMTDFHDDLRYRRQFEEEGIYSISPTVFLLKRFDLLLTWNHLQRRIRLFDMRSKIPEDRFFIVNQPLAESRPYLAEIEVNIGSIYDFCRDRLAAYFVLFCSPRSFQYSDKESPKNWEKRQYTVLGPYVHEPFVWLEEFSRAVPFPVFSLLEDFLNSGVFPTCFVDDPHWNADGHRIAAEGILKRLEMLFDQKRLGLPHAAPSH